MRLPDDVCADDAMDYEVEASRCIGKVGGCILPDSADHNASECVTVEDMEAQADQEGTDGP